MQDILGSVVNGSNILKMINKNTKTAIIIDEFDNMTKGEKSSIKQIFNFIENQFLFLD